MLLNHKFFANIAMIMLLAAKITTSALASDKKILTEKDSKHYNDARYYINFSVNITPSKENIFALKEGGENALQKVFKEKECGLILYIDNDLKDDAVDKTWDLGLEILEKRLNDFGYNNLLNLQFLSCGMTDEGALSVANIIKNNQGLQIFDLSTTFFLGNKGTKILTNELKFCQKLHDLRISSLIYFDEIGKEDISDDIIELIKNTSLHNIDIPSLPEIGAKKIINFIIQTKTDIEYLGFAVSEMTKEEYETLDITLDVNKKRNKKE